MNLNSFIRVQKKYFFECKFEFADLFSRLGGVLKSSGVTETPSTVQLLNCPGSNIPITDPYQLSNYLNN